MTIRFQDAASLERPGIPALSPVDGWHTKRLLVLIGLGVLSSIFVTALATVLGKSVEVGLIAGTYAMGIIAVLIGTLT